MRSVPVAYGLKDTPDLYPEGKPHSNKGSA